MYIPHKDRATSTRLVSAVCAIVVDLFVLIVIFRHATKFTHKTVVYPITKGAEDKKREWKIGDLSHPSQVQYDNNFNKTNNRTLGLCNE